MDSHALEPFVSELLELRRSRLVTLPVKSRVAQFAEGLLELLYPHFSDEVFYSGEEIEGQLRLLRRDLQTTLQPLRGQMPCSAEEVAERFFAAVPGIYRKLCLDAEAIHRGEKIARLRETRRASR